MSARRIVAAAVAGGVAGLFALAPPASADVSGPCTASLAGVDAAGRSASDPDAAIDVGPDDVIDVAVVASQPIGPYSVQLEFAGFRWTVAADETGDTSWTKAVEVADYSRFGVGLYRVHAVSGGAAPCDGAVLVRVTGSPFGTVAGWAALAVTAIGVGATVAAARPPRRTPTASMVLGGLGGLGAIALAQQLALLYPTRTVTLIGVAAGIAAPLAAGRLAGTPPGTAAPTGGTVPAPLDLPHGPPGGPLDLPHGPPGGPLDLPHGPPGGPLDPPQGPRHADTGQSPADDLRYRR